MEEEHVVKRLEDVVSNGDSGNQSEDSPVDKEDVQDDEPEELVIKKIISHCVNKSHKYPHAVHDEKLYRVHWY